MGGLQHQIRSSVLQDATAALERTRSLMDDNTSILKRKHSILLKKDNRFSTLNMRGSNLSVVFRNKNESSLQNNDSRYIKKGPTRRLQLTDEDSLRTSVEFSYEDSSIGSPNSIPNSREEEVANIVKKKSPPIDHYRHPPT